MPAIARDGGAGEPAELSVLLATVETQVSQTVERDKVLDAGKQLEGKVSLKIARSLAAIWNVRQKVGGINRTVSDMAEEVHVNVTKAAMRLLQTQEAQAKGPKRRATKHTDPTKKLGYPREPMRSKCKTRAQRVWRLGQASTTVHL